MKIDRFLKPSPKDSRDFIAKISPPATFPRSVDLKPWADEVENQLQYGSCTANAGCSLLELEFNKRKSLDLNFSRMFLYYYARKLSGLLDQDGGAYPRDLCRAMKNYGTCYEDSWKYAHENLSKEPTPEVLKEAEEFKVLSYSRLTGRDQVEEVRKSLSQGIPVLLTMKVHSDFMSLKGDWKTHDWKLDQMEGYHMVLVIGYDDDSNRILCENSWGRYWGDGGFFGIPYEKVNSDVVSELWIVEPNIPSDEEEDVQEETQDEEVSPEPTPDPVPEPKKKDKSVIGIVLAAIGALVAGLIAFL